MENKNYDISLFKPANEYGRKNRNIIISMLIIWFLAIFGFQFLLRYSQTPTPEKSLVTFESVWGNVKNGNSSLAEKQDFIKSLILVSGKLTLKPEKKVVLKDAISWASYSMLADSEKTILSGYIGIINASKEKLATAKDEEYLQLKSEIEQNQSKVIAMLSSKIGLEPNGLEASILPYMLNAEANELSEETATALPGVMKKYCIHNQSFLTDFRFLGFPFHYFYSSEFLLFLFVFLTLLYHIRIEKLQKKYGIVEN